MKPFIPAVVIKNKRDGKELSTQEIQDFIAGLKTGAVTDYQATAWLMAVFFKGMKLNETVALTTAMRDSGEVYKLDQVPGFKVDKHSTGGVGDKVSLILAPLAAACGVKVPMMSGRALGHTGGTIDKLESIPGFNVNLTRVQFEKVLTEIGCAMIGQSEKIVPADKKLYALRDVTATVECVPLIAASILSKKLAEGAQALVLDVKVGSGAFMKSKKEAKQLATTIAQISKKLGLPCRAILTDMSQPLGCSAGNILEVQECVRLLNPADPNNNQGCTADLREVTLTLVAHMVVLAKKAPSLQAARRMAVAKLADGSAYEIFKKLIKLQGGNLSYIEDLTRFPSAPIQIQWKSKKKGYLSSIDTTAIGELLIELKAGRKKAQDSIDPTTGIVFHKKLGSKVEIGDPVVTVHAPNGIDLNALEVLFWQSLTITSARKPSPTLIQETIGV